MASIAIGHVLRKLDEVEKELNSTARKLLRIRSLREELKDSLLPYLRDAEQKRRDPDNEEALNWVDEIRRVAFELEDTLDWYVFHKRPAASRPRLRWSKTACFKSFVDSSLRTVTHVVTRRSLTGQIASILRRLRQSAEESHKYEKIPNSTIPASPSSKDDSIRMQASDDIEFESLETLIEQLTKPRVKKRNVISIIGPGGVGKTTLAHRIYHHEKVIEYFVCRSWVTALQTYGVVDILTSILKDIMGLSDNVIAGMNEQVMKTKLSEHLGTRRYLIVIDDVQDKGVWESLEATFPLRSEGSMVLITTRDPNIASNGDPYRARRLFKLNRLIPEESWKLFCRKAFSDGVCPPELQQFKDVVVDSCAGLPLAIVFLADMLHKRNPSEDEWRKVLKDIKKDTTNVHTTIVRRAIALRYDDLPNHLKSCFLYLAAYPADSSIHAQDLMQLWIAEGFIQLVDEKKGSDTMEDLAKRNLNELIVRSMVQPLGRDEFGDITLISMHDILHDFARDEAKRIDFLHIHDEITDDFLSPEDRRCRRVSLHLGADSYLANLDHNNSNDTLRSLLGIFPTGLGFSKELDLHRFKLLRVIDLQGIKLKALPNGIGGLIFLRYLCLRNTCLTTLPEFVGELLNLQMLDLRGTRVGKITKSFWNIKTLRHVYVPVHFFKSEPCPHDNLDNLQTLDGVLSGRWVVNDLAKMPNLRHLTLSKVSASEGKELGDAIEKLKHLTSLKLEGDSFPTKLFTLSDLERLREVELSGLLESRHWVPSLESQQLLPNLAVLSFINSELKLDDIAMLGKLPKLRSLVLWKSYHGMELIFARGSFYSLQELVLLYLVELKEWKVEDDAMPRLVRLTISSCKLNKLPERMKHIQTLKNISLGNVPAIKEQIEKKQGEDYEMIKDVVSLF